MSTEAGAVVEDAAVEPVGSGGDLIAVRRNLLLSGIVGGLLALIGLAFLIRGNGFLDALVGVLLLALGALNLVSLGSWQAPVLVADEQGIRLRAGTSWRGLPWGAIRQVVVEHADSPLRGGRLVVVPRDPEAVLGELAGLAAVHVRWNRFWYDAPLAIPLGMTTFVDSPDLAGDLRALSRGRVDIADLRGKNLANLDEVPDRVRPQAAAPAYVDAEPEAHEAPAVPEDVRDAVEPVVELPPPPEDDLPDPVRPMRSLRRPTRVEVRLERPAAADPEHRPTAPAAADWHHLPGTVTAEMLAETGPFLPPLPVVGGSEGPEVTPVIGPTISHAREMLDMEIEELSERTRIRPHVLEAMEVDDFAPCGGDVYARGHLTSVARVLGLEAETLTALYDEHYAQGPINARRVFEAELSSGISGGTRTRLGGPSWSLLVSAVLCLTMVWGLARMFSGDPEQLTAAPPASEESAGLAANHEPITSPIMKTTTMTVTAAHAPAHVVIRDRTGLVLWSGDLPQAGHRQVAGLAPFQVESDNGGAVVVKVRGKDLGAVGMAGRPAAKNFG